MRHAAFISTPAKLDTCPRCAELILAAIVDGFDTLADPYAVEAAGELICRLAGRASFVAEIAPHSLLLYCRHAEHIRYSDPRPVLVQHACLSPPSAIDQRETQRVLGVFINADEITYSENPPF